MKTVEHVVPPTPTKLKRSKRPSVETLAALNRIHEPGNNGNGAEWEEPDSSHVVDVPPMVRLTAYIPIVGISALVTHKWSAKALKMMLGGMEGEGKPGREKKNPWQEFLDSLYPLGLAAEGQPERYGVPSPAFKASAVCAANDVQLKMTTMKRAFHVDGYTIEVKAPPFPKSKWSEYDERYKDKLEPFHALGIGMRMDPVRVGQGKPDLRFRGWWLPGWTCLLKVTFNPHVILLPALLNLFRHGGSDAGICEGRPSAPMSKTGEWGRYDVQSMETVKAILEQR